MTAVKTPPNVVTTPEALFRAVRVKDPVVLIDLMKEPPILQQPKAINSCVASTDFPFAEKTHFSYQLQMLRAQNLLQI